MQAATFGRLCVETGVAASGSLTLTAATFGCLCVETHCDTIKSSPGMQPPSGGCVLKLLFMM